MSSPNHQWVVAPRANMFCPSGDTPLGNILILEPEGESQTSLAPSLAVQGYAVYTLDTASDAWELITEMRPDLILLDVKLADLSGFDMCRQLKQSVQTRRIPVLFLGEGYRKADRLQAFKVGGADFIPKPYWVEEVIARVQLHVSQGRVQRRVQHHTRRALSERGNLPLLATLQRTLHQQAVNLQEQNAQLQQEVQERQQMEQALRQEQQKSEQLLLNILPEAIVEQLKQFQGSLATRF